MLPAGGAQHRLEVGLGHPLVRLARLGAVVLLANLPPLAVHRGLRPDREPLAGEPGRPDHVEAVLGRDARRADLVSDAELGVKLHGPRVGELHFGVQRRAGVLLGQQARHPMACQLERGDHADRAGPDDEHRRVFHDEPPHEPPGTRSRIGRQAHAGRHVNAPFIGVPAAHPVATLLYQGSRARERIIRQMAGDEMRGRAQAVVAAALASGWSHRHRDVSGGWLRPTVFGAVDGLVTNASLIAGLGGGGVSAHTVVLSGAAALVAGAFSMGTGEYVSVTNQNELVHAEVAVERRMHARFPAAEQAELAETFRGYGADSDTAARMAAAVSRDPDTALRVHTREELGVDPFELPSAALAGVSSLIAFSLGALVPLLPYLFGLPVLAATLGVAAVALGAGGMAVGRLTGRPMLRSGLRQLALGGVVVAVTFAVGTLIGSNVTR